MNELKRLAWSTQDAKITTPRKTQNSSSFQLQSQDDMCGPVAFFNFRTWHQKIHKQSSGQLDLAQIGRDMQCTFEHGVFEEDMSAFLKTTCPSFVRTTTSHRLFLQWVTKHPSQSAIVLEVFDEESQYGHYYFVYFDKVRKRVVCRNTIRKGRFSHTCSTVKQFCTNKKADWFVRAWLLRA